MYIDGGASNYLQTHAMYIYTRKVQRALLKSDVRSFGRLRFSPIYIYMMYKDTVYTYIYMSIHVYKFARASYNCRDTLLVYHPAKRTTTPRSIPKSTATTAKTISYIYTTRILHTYTYIQFWRITFA